MIDIRKRIIVELKKILPDEEITLETPPDMKLGDFAFPCFSLSRKLKKDPGKIASELCEKIEVGGGIRKVSVNGPYLNFYIDEIELAKELLPAIINGEYKIMEKPEVILVESPGPNTNKPLHLGHLRNILLGSSIIAILRLIGHDVHHVNVVNDRGVHICKSMLAYKMFGENRQPENIKPDHFVGDFYVRYAKEAAKNPDLEKEIQDMLVKWEEGDPQVRALWKKMNSWALEGFNETYKRLGIDIEKEYFESDTYKSGKEIVLSGLSDGVFEKEKDGAIIVDLEEKKLGRKILLRANGTAVYITQDLYMAELRYKDYKFDRMIYVVGNEQQYHFKVLFEIFRRLKLPFAENCFHFSYGMVELPEGKMKSREGTVIDADDLMDDMIKRAEEEVRKRYDDISEKEVKERAEAIGMAAIKFFFLKFDPMKDFVFSPKESLSFEGETGPYVQYTHARICSILKKAPKPRSFDAKFFEEPESKNLIKVLYLFNEAVTESAQKYNPARIARYLLDLCQRFNEYYHKYPVLKEQKDLRDARLMLIDAVRQIISDGLGLLGIKAPERM